MPRTIEVYPGDAMEWFSNKAQIVQATAVAIGVVTTATGAFGDTLPVPVRTAVAGFGVGVLLTVVLMLLVWPKRTPSAPLDTVMTPPSFAPLDVYFEGTEDPKIVFKRKLRIVLRNESGKDVVVGATRWEMRTGDIGLQPRPEPCVWQIEPPEGWQGSSWRTKEESEIHAAPGKAIRTWIGLHAGATEIEVRRHQVSKQLGTLVIPLRIDGQNRIERIRL